MVKGDQIFHIQFFLQFGFCLQLHRDMCRVLSAVVCKVLEIFPDLEAARPRSKSGIQALCSLHIALEKAKNLLQHCSSCSKLYLVCFLSLHFLRIKNENKLLLY